MWDLYDEDDVTAAEKAAAMAALLRGQRSNANMGAAFGNLGLLTGDKVLGNFGKAALGGAQDQIADAARQEGLLAQAGQFRLSKALAAKQAEMDRQVRKDEMRQRGLDRALQREMYGLTKQQAAEDKRTGDNEKSIEALSKRLEGAPGIRQDIATLAAAADEKDIPGVGPWAGLMPDWAVSDAGLKVRQAARGVVRGVVSETSGKAASDKEVDRILGELGMKETAGENAYRLGLQGLADKTRALIKAKEAGYRPEVVQEARARGLVASEDIPTYRPGAKGLSDEEAQELAELEEWERKRRK